MITIDQLKELCRENIEKGLSKFYREQAAFFLHIIEKNEAFEKEIAALKRETESLKCCGNCLNYFLIKDNSLCPKKHLFENYAITRKRNYFCPSWESDNLTQKERSI